VEVQVALALLVVLWNADLDGFGTTALGVLDGLSVLVARGALLASGSVGHPIEDLDVDLLVSGDINVANGEVLVTADFVGGLLGDLCGNALGVEGTLLNLIALALDGTAGPPLEVEVLVLVEAARVEVGPVKALLLLWWTFVLDVAWAWERLKVSPELWQQ
jgi:hypothetical protein